MDIKVKPKKFIAIPRDAYELLNRRYATFDEAADAATESCADDGQSVMVVELKVRGITKSLDERKIAIDQAHDMSSTDAKFVQVYRTFLQGSGSE